MAWGYRCLPLGVRDLLQLSYLPADANISVTPAVELCQLGGPQLPVEPPEQRVSGCCEDQASVGSYALPMSAEPPCSAQQSPEAVPCSNW